MSRKRTMAAVCAACALAMGVVVAEEGRELEQAEVVELFTDVTFDGVYLPKNKAFVAYDAPDGKLEILRPNGERDRGRTWFVNDEGQRCATNPKWKEPRCFELFDRGDGTYHQYFEGKHVHTLSNLRRGNQL